jgi:hypothetical protein
MKRIVLAALAAVALAVGAFAQTVPPFGPGTLPTAQVWNGYFSSKQDLMTNPSVISALGYTPISAPITGGSGTVIYGFPAGWGNSAAVLCVRAFLTGGAECPVTGGVASNPNGFATYTSRDLDNFVPTIYGPSTPLAQAPAQLISQQPGTFTATSFIPTTPLTSGQLALLAFRDQLKSSDGCLATLNNWTTDGVTLYVNGWYCGANLTTPSGTSAQINRDNASLSGAFTNSTTFTFTTPLTPTQIAYLKVRMPVDTDDNPICSGALTSWDAVGGTWIQVSSGFFARPSGAACTPVGAHVIIGDMYKVFDENTVTNLYPYSRAYQMAEEHACDNSEMPWLTGSNLAITPNGMWCIDIVNLGNYMDQYGLVIRGNGSNTQQAFYSAINVEAGAQTAVSVYPSNNQSVGIAFGSRGAMSGNNTISDSFRDWDASGNIWAQLKSNTGIWNLGNQGASSSPGVKFFSSGTATPDSSIIATGGSGTTGTGTITATTTAFKASDSSGNSITLNTGATPTISSNNGNSIAFNPGVMGTAFAISNVGSMVNGVRIVSATTGNAPIIRPIAGDANISLLLESIGTGAVKAQPGSDSSVAFAVNNAAGSTTVLGVDTTNSIVTVGGGFYTSGTTPTIGSCGTSPTISGTDVSGKITVGSGTVTSCVISFHATLPNAPHGVVLTAANSTAAPGTTTGAYISALSTSNWTLTGLALAGASYYYHVE